MFQSLANFPCFLERAAEQVLYFELSSRSGVYTFSSCDSRKKGHLYLLWCISYEFGIWNWLHLAPSSRWCSFTCPRFQPFAGKEENGLFSFSKHDSRCSNNGRVEAFRMWGVRRILVIQQWIFVNSQSLFGMQSAQKFASLYIRLWVVQRFEKQASVARFPCVQLLFICFMWIFGEQIAKSCTISFSCHVLSDR